MEADKVRKQKEREEEHKQKVWCPLFFWRALIRIVWCFKVLEKIRREKGVRSEPVKEEVRNIDH
jgi:hypothetical protein